MRPIGDQSSVPLERTAVPVGPPWPRVVEGRCSWCGDLESAHEGGVREHHRIEVIGGRYDDEPETLRPGPPAPVDPGSVMAFAQAEPLRATLLAHIADAEQRVLDVVRDLFVVLDAHGYRRTSDDAALGRAVVAVWQLVDEYEGQ